MLWSLPFQLCSAELRGLRTWSPAAWGWGAPRTSHPSPTRTAKWCESWMGELLPKQNTSFQGKDVCGAMWKTKKTTKQCEHRKFTLSVAWFRLVLLSFPFLKHVCLPREAGHTQSKTEGSPYNGTESGKRESLSSIQMLRSSCIGQSKRSGFMVVVLFL